MDLVDVLMGRGGPNQQKTPLFGTLAMIAEPSPPEPPDFSALYNTPLSPGEQAEYQAWLRQLAASMGRDVSRDNFDYDMQGAWKSGQTAAGNGHFPDTFKKPNHPTFSDQSQYNGAEGYRGGAWGGTDDRPVFTASEANVSNMGRGGLFKYFQSVEPNARLVLPKWRDR